MKTAGVSKIDTEDQIKWKLRTGVTKLKLLERGQRRRKPLSVTIFSKHVYEKKSVFTVGIIQ